MQAKNDSQAWIVCTFIFICLFSSSLSIPFESTRVPKNPDSVRRIQKHLRNRQKESQDRILDESDDAETRRLLDVFGLRTIPRPPRKRMKTPPFMYQLYQQLEGISEGFAPNFKDGANTVRSFLEDGKSSSGRNEFSFNVNGILRRESVLFAELHLFKQRPRQNKMLDTTTDFGDTNGNVSIRVYLVQNDRASSSDKRKLFITERTVNISYIGWLDFDVTSAFSQLHSMFQNEENLEELNPIFEIRVKTVNKTLKKLISFTKVPNENHSERTPLLALFLNDKSIKIRDIKPPEASRNVENEHLDDEEENLVLMRRKKRASTKSKRANNQKKSKCQLLDFYVDFQKVGWSDWIIAPNGYNANFCEGNCPFPLDPKFNATNHATVQAILHTRGFSRKGSTLPNPCCVPDKFESIHVLYLDDYNNVVLKEFDAMVATSCGCH
ncbi:bone morphogenetic protein 2-like [Anneissia japonica]|uniref:bone morphogenetic protein 2-like n=1 Tax=Anneissia japonica TaxID=1529436 RepID=UPI001425A9DE|nr:bone morphogenetic protein 2-like [Anneissia japonica]